MQHTKFILEARLFYNLDFIRSTGSIDWLIKIIQAYCIKIIME